MPLQRVEEYLISGMYANNAQYSKARSSAILVSLRKIIGAAMYFSSKISPQFYAGSAQHETNFALNEVDIEVSGYVSIGLFQLSVDEAKGVGMAGANLCDFMTSMEVFTKVMEPKLDTIRQALISIGAKPSKPQDIWPYLAISHNQGLQAALQTIAIHGLDWTAYKARNPTLGIVSSGYGDDCVSGGPNWPVGLIIP